LEERAKLIEDETGRTTAHFDIKLDPPGLGLKYLANLSGTLTKGVGIGRCRLLL
jgi:hypothetical protein